jgi:hypothetical protein
MDIRESIRWSLGHESCISLFDRVQEYVPPFSVSEALAPERSMITLVITNLDKIWRITGVFPFD